MLIVLALYFLIGIVLLAVGPFRRMVSEAVEDARRSPLANAIAGRPEVPEVSETKLLLFRTILSFGIVLLWPVFLPSVLRENARNNLHPKEDHMPVDADVRFQYMGGAGKIRCLECGYSKGIVSFIHGIDTCTAGYQCQSCGGFIELHDSISDRVEGRCTFGGTIARDWTLFCPQCGSKKLRYNMEYIT